MLNRQIRLVKSLVLMQRCVHILRQNPYLGFNAKDERLQQGQTTRQCPPLKGMWLLKRKPHVGVVAIGNSLGNSIVSGLSTKQTEQQAKRKGNEAFAKAKAAGMTDAQASKVATDEMLSMLPADKRRQLF